MGVCVPDVCVCCICGFGGVCLFRQCVNVCACVHMCLHVSDVGVSVLYG